MTFNNYTPQISNWKITHIKQQTILLELLHFHLNHDYPYKQSKATNKTVISNKQTKIAALVASRQPSLSRSHALYSWFRLKKALHSW